MPQVLNKVYKYLSNGSSSSSSSGSKKKNKKRGGRKKKTMQKGATATAGQSGARKVRAVARTPLQAKTRSVRKGRTATSTGSTTRTLGGRKKQTAAQQKAKAVQSTPSGSRRLPNKQKPLLPPQLANHVGKLTVVLDMDETLLHSEFLGLDEDLYRQEEERLTDRTVEADHVVSLVCEDIEGEVAIRKRPYFDAFLEQACQDYEVILFTAGHEEYASRVLDVVDADHKITHRLFRQSTVTYRGQGFVKDLSRLGRDMRRIVLLDNNFLAMLASPDNSIPIFDFYGDPKDEELKSTLILLRYLAKMEDVRPFLRKTFQVRKKFDELGDLLEVEKDEYEPSDEHKE